MKKKLVLKVGSSTLTTGSNRISYGKIEDIARQALLLQAEYDILIVTSGAIATAQQFIDMRGYEKKVEMKQAMSAIGQPKLMRIYDEVFESLGLKVAQCLLTYRDFEDAKAAANTRNTLETLLAHQYIPLINENDTVGIEEIILGDNDKLSAYVAHIIDADLLMIASDINGIYNMNPHLHPEALLIEEITDIQSVSAFIEEKNNGLGTGGMTSKLQAVEVCRQKNIEVWIVNGHPNRFMTDTLSGKCKCSKFRPSPTAVKG